MFSKKSPRKRKYWQHKNEKKNHREAEKKNYSPPCHARVSRGVILS
jgi:hypothetical protein